MVRIDRIKLTTEMMKQDLTQTKLAERSGISRVTINAIKAGKRCSDEVGRKIAAGLGIPVEELIEK